MTTHDEYYVPRLRPKVPADPMLTEEPLFVTRVIEPEHTTKLPPAMSTVPVRVRPAKSWGANTFSSGIPNVSVNLLPAQPGRQSVTISNQGATTVFVGPAESVDVSGEGGCAVPPAASRTLGTSGAVWCIGSAAWSVDAEWEYGDG